MLNELPRKTRYRGDRRTAKLTLRRSLRRCYAISFRGSPRSANKRSNQAPGRALATVLRISLLDPEAR
jgi:hypothetical protein